MHVRQMAAMENKQAKLSKNLENARTNLARANRLLTSIKTHAMPVPYEV